MLSYVTQQYCAKWIMTPTIKLLPEWLSYIAKWISENARILQVQSQRLLCTRLSQKNKMYICPCARRKRTRWVEVQPHSFLTSALDGRWRLDRFISGDIVAGTLQQTSTNTLDPTVWLCLGLSYFQKRFKFIVGYMLSWIICTRYKHSSFHFKLKVRSLHKNLHKIKLPRLFRPFHHILKIYNVFRVPSRQIHSALLSDTTDITQWRNHGIMWKANNS
jgi:hypothetical protein